MVLSENPSCNSVRIQRASRINNIEQGRLSHRMHLLDKERIRKIRLANQDIRIINLTLDFIHSSSGQSPEGLAPEDCGKDSEAGTAAEVVDPCFMYGERLNSRRFGKNRRASSAVGSVTSSLRWSEVEEEEEEEGGEEEEAAAAAGTTVRPLHPRPHSSPTRRRSSAMGLQPDTPGGAGEGEAPRRLSKRPSTASGVFRTTAALSAEPVSGNPRLPPARLGFSQTTRPRSAGALQQAQLPGDPGPEAGDPPRPATAAAGGVPQTRGNKPTLHARNSRITQAVSQARVKATEVSKQKKLTIHNLWLGPLAPKTPKQRRVMEARKAEARRYMSVVNKKLSYFYEKHPLQKF